jgi:two-component system CheB/CheR fusion protein
MPYRTLDDRIEGLVITFFNISDLKQVEIKLQETEQINHLLLNSSPDVIIRLSADLKILEFSPEAVKFFGKNHEEAVNRNYIQMFVSEQARKKVKNDLDKVFNEMRDGKIKMQVIAAKGKVQVVEFSVKVLLNNLKMAEGMIIITNRKLLNHD